MMHHVFLVPLRIIDFFWGKNGTMYQQHHKAYIYFLVKLSYKYE
jgi:hypothetical protein